MHCKAPSLIFHMTLHLQGCKSEYIHVSLFLHIVSFLAIIFSQENIGLRFLESNRFDLRIYVVLAYFKGVKQYTPKEYL